MRDPAGRYLEAAQLYEEARVRRAEGNASGAFARYRRVLEMVEAAGDRPWKAELLAELGQMYQENYDIPSARRWYGDAVALYQELGDAAQAASILLKLAQVEQLSGNMEAAEQGYREALALTASEGDTRGEGIARAGLGQLLWEVKRDTEGASELVAGIALLRACAAPEAEGVLESVRAWKRRIGPVRYRQLIQSATPDPELRELLLV
jgi:tetratricopeptide (TPR) repeat protein